MTYQFISEGVTEMTVKKLLKRCHAMYAIVYDEANSFTPVKQTLADARKHFGNEEVSIWWINSTQCNTVSIELKGLLYDEE